MLKSAGSSPKTIWFKWQVCVEAGNNVLSCKWLLSEFCAGKASVLHLGGAVLCCY